MPTKPAPTTDTPTPPLWPAVLYVVSMLAMLNVLAVLVIFNSFGRGDFVSVASADAVAYRECLGAHNLPYRVQGGALQMEAYLVHEAEVCTLELEP